MSRPPRRGDVFWVNLDSVVYRIRARNRARICGGDMGSKPHFMLFMRFWRVERIPDWRYRPSFAIRFLRSPG